MNILHLEASPGWGGQEIRILKEAIGMRKRGHTVLFAIQKGGGLIKPAKEAGFCVYEVPFTKKKLLQATILLISIIRREKIDILNTHSSLDAWLGGFLAKCMRKPVIRTRHLSTPIKEGLNSTLLYNTLADYVVTTCAAVATKVKKQARLPDKRCRSIPTGIELSRANVDPKSVAAFRQKLGCKEGDVLAGTCCVLRGWKGINELLLAAKQLEHLSYLKWIVIGSGVSEAHFIEQRNKLNLEQTVSFVGHQSPPDVAIAALDIFLLLSWAHEGVSQASLQAALLGKPLITTTVGGLPEVCVAQKTGFVVPPKNVDGVVKAMEKLIKSPQLRDEMGEKATELVKGCFSYTTMLDQMEEVYKTVCHNLK